MTMEATNDAQSDVTDPQCGPSKGIASLFRRFRLLKPAFVILFISFVARETCIRILATAHPRYETIYPTFGEPGHLEAHTMIAFEALNSIGEQRVLALGSSSGLYAFRTRSLGPPLDSETWNCCSAEWTGIDGQAALFDVYLRTHRPPELLLLIFHPMDLAIGIAGNDWRSRVLAACGVENHDLRELPSYERATRSAKMFVNRLAGVDNYRRFRSIRDARWRERGWQESTDELKEVPRSAYVFSEIAFNDSKRLLMLNFCNKAREHGVKVMLLLTPLICEPGIEYRNGLKATLASIVEEAQGTLIIPGNLIVLPPRAFRDEVHCTTFGAEVFMQAVRQHILDHLNSSDSPVGPIME
jgi:hypothetical protein